ncbi:CoA transferase [Sesbania bispinosa]|nr:CoA transferase [Sesbania bispinosa]
MARWWSAQGATETRWFGCRLRARWWLLIEEEDGGCETWRTPAARRGARRLSSGEMRCEAGHTGEGMETTYARRRWKTVMRLIGESTTAVQMKSEARTVGGQRPGGAACGGG